MEDLKTLLEVVIVIAGLFVLTGLSNTYLSDDYGVNGELENQIQLEDFTAYASKRTNLARGGDGADCLDRCLDACGAAGIDFNTCSDKCLDKCSTKKAGKLSSSRSIAKKN